MSVLMFFFVIVCRDFANIGQCLSNICQYLSMYGTAYVPTYYTVLRTVRYCVLVYTYAYVYIYIFMKPARGPQTMIFGS